MNIELLTLSEVVDVAGTAGDFNISVRQNPRYIDMEKCIACGLCAEKCPRKVHDEFNGGLNKRKAAYIKYGQTVPLKYAIDADHCLYLTKGKCRACEKFCPTGAIRFEDRPQMRQLSVGAVILAPGFKPFDPSPFEFYGYRQFPDVVTSLEYERLLSASGPCMGHLVRPSDGKAPRRIAWLQCVGSRNTNQCGNGYCSSVCCMYAIKEALVTSEHLSGGEVAQTIFFMDIRTHGKEFERYYESAKAKGVRFVRARPHTIMPGPGNTGAEVTFTTEDGRQQTEAYDMLVLSVGLEPPADAADMAERFDFQLDQFGFAATTNRNTVATTREGVYVTGAFQSPKAIPRSVTEASAAAAEAARSLAAAKGSLTREKTYPAEMAVADQPPRIGVFVCSCGINIANVVDVEAVAGFARTLPNVVNVENNLFTCSTDTQNLIAESIKTHALNRVVVAACTPRTHEALFQDTLKNAGLNGYLFEMANIRNQNAWVHQDEPEKATAKAMDQVRMAVAKVSLNEPLTPLTVDVAQRAMVIGGGLAGMTAAMGLADAGYRTVLLEQGERLGGNACRLMRTWKGEAIRDIVQETVKRIEDHERIDVLKQARLLSTTGSVGDFSSKVEVDGQTRSLTYGAAVIATGGREHRPRTYLYGQDERVMTHQEFDARQEDPDFIRRTGSVVFIQCVGSRDPERPYCSRVCCTHSMASAIHLKTVNPDLDVYVLYRDIRTYGEREQLYEQARRLGVVFIRFDLDRRPMVARDGGELVVKTHDPICGMDLTIAADAVVLAAAIVPNDTAELVELFKCGINEDGMVNEAHPKLRPVETPVDGLFLAGLCNYPKPVEESLVQAQAAVSRASAVLNQEKMQLDAVKSQVTDNCDGCALCVDVCPYRAIALETAAEGGRSVKRITTDKALCKGCGICAATCPKEGIQVGGFTNAQIRAQLYAALQSVG